MPGGHRPPLTAAPPSVLPIPTRSGMTARKLHLQITEALNDPIQKILFTDCCSASGRLVFRTAECAGPSKGVRNCVRYRLRFGAEFSDTASESLSRSSHRRV